MPYTVKRFLSYSFGFMCSLSLVCALLLSTSPAIQAASATARISLSATSGPPKTPKVILVAKSKTTLTLGLSSFDAERENGLRHQYPGDKLNKEGEEP